jgi:hypothetical protein
MNLSKIEQEALADLVAKNISDRQKLAAELGTTTNTKFCEELLRKLNGDNK